MRACSRPRSASDGSVLHCEASSYYRYMCIHPAGRKLINSGRGVFEQCIHEIISTNFSKTAIREN